MSLLIEKPGLESLIQGRPRSGLRHLGMPWAGPADPLSAALANRLVCNPADTPLVEICFGGFQACFESAASLALTGAIAVATLDESPISFHQTVAVAPGSTLRIGVPSLGLRSYLAIAGGVAVPHFLDSTSTYAPSRIGGYQGRKLQTGDRLRFGRCDGDRPLLTTPTALHPFLTRHWRLRCCHSAEAQWLTPASKRVLFEQLMTVGSRSNRMGMQWIGQPLCLDSKHEVMASSPVFPGIVQCPPDGAPFVLGVDAQTTGGYPRVASVIRADRHRLGQLRPGDTVGLIETEIDEAHTIYREKRAAVAE
ncbi:MAG: biotin-dependent carboxyltransferase family protein, partial [Planctomycetota bacterium]